jgi:hypothetical protein
MSENLLNTSELASSLATSFSTSRKNASATFGLVMIESESRPTVAPNSELKLHAIESRAQLSGKESGQSVPFAGIGFAGSGTARSGPNLRQLAE